MPKPYYYRGDVLTWRKFLKDAIEKATPVSHNVTIKPLNLEFAEEVLKTCPLRTTNALGMNRYGIPKMVYRKNEPGISLSIREVCAAAHASYCFAYRDFCQIANDPKTDKEIITSRPNRKEPKKEMVMESNPLYLQT